MNTNNDEYVEYEEVTNQEDKKQNLINTMTSDEDFMRNFMKLHTPLNATPLPGRNDICPFCDSGLKFKKCKCFQEHQKEYRNKYYL